MSVFLNRKHIEKFLELLDEKDKINAQIRNILAGAIFRESKPESTSKSAMPETGVGIPTDGWTSYATKGPAGSNEPAWRFASDRDDRIYPEVEALVDRIYESGKVEQGGFTFTLSKDGKFLQRNRARKSGGFKK